MIHPEERSDAEPVGKKSSVFFAVMLFLAIIAIAIFGYVKSQGMELKNIPVWQLFSGNNKVKLLNETSDILEIPYDTSEHPVFGVYMDYIIRCGRDGIWFLDRKGREQWSVGVPLSNPLIKTNGKDLLVADIGGREIYVISGKDVSWKEKTDENIQNAEINEKGFVTVITSSKLYNGEVRVYDNHGIELLKSVIANDFAVTARIAPSGKQMVFDLINASGVKSYTYFKFMDMSGKELAVKSMQQDKGLYPFVWFSDRDSIFTAGDTAIAFLDKDRNIKWEKQFLKINSAGITGSGRLAAAVINENIPGLKVFSLDGREYSAARLEREAVNINAFGGVIAVNTGRKACFFTERCKSKGEYSSRSDILNVLFFNGQQAAVITTSYIAIVDLG